MNVIIPLLGTVAAATAAYFAYNKVSKEQVLEYQYKQFGDGAVRLSSKHIVTVLVLGFQNQGRSSFINTIFRVLYKEEGPLIMRAETGNIKISTTGPRVFKVKNKLLRYPKHLMNIIDAPCLSTFEDMDETAVRNALRGRRSNENNVLKTDPSQQSNFRRIPECVIFVIKAEDCYTGGPALDPLSKLVRIIREEGLQFIVVLTHKKEAQKKSIDLLDLTRSVVMKAGTDVVYCIENYVADHLAVDRRKPWNVKNHFETHKQTLIIMRQCLEYVRQRRLIKLHGIQAYYDSSASD